ncbi:MAG: amidohydrolase family protein [Chloroflexi bacterium]|nr:amidohydrolase family protein [Chloroflexota bacterium]
MTYDLLLKNGYVTDPSQGLSGNMDVAFSAGKVAAIEADIAPASAREVVDVTGKFVTPGLIDCHAHICRGMPVTGGCNPDVTHIPNGCTSIIEPGSLGAPSFPAMRQIIAATKCRVFTFVHLSRLGIKTPKPPFELRELSNADPEGAARAVLDNKDIALGIKVRLTFRGTSGNDVQALDLAVRAAELCKRSILVHVGNSLITMPEILARLRPGDMVTHMYTLESNGIVDSRLRVLDAVWEARQRGIFFDCSRGSTQSSFMVTRAAVGQGFLPDCISTDISGAADRTDLLMNMSDFLAFGLSFEEVVRRVTANPARVIGQHISAPGLGNLRVGAAQDAAVLDVLHGDFTYTDPLGVTIEGNRRITCLMTIKDGRIIWRAKEATASPVAAMPASHS